METTAVTPGSITPRTSRPGFEGLDSEDFFKLLIAQLSNQDPLQPTSNQELLNQLSSIRDIEASTRLTRTLDSLSARQGFGSAAGLMGQYVAGSAASADGTTVAVGGVVVGLRVDPEGLLTLVLDTGEELPMSAVEQVTTTQRFAETLKGRWVSGLDRRDPANPKPVQGIVTGAKTDSTGQVLLELDNGQQLRLADVTAVSDSPEDAAEETAET